MKEERAMTTYRRSHDRSGYVYIITRSDDPEWITVGMTRNLKHRLRRFNRYTPRQNFKLEAAFRFEDCRWGERLAHDALARKAMKDHEWFKISVEDAIHVIKAIPDAHQIEIPEAMATSGFIMPTKEEQEAHLMGKRRAALVKYVKLFCGHSRKPVKPVDVNHAAFFLDSCAIDVPQSIPEIRDALLRLAGATVADPSALAVRR
jgi:hypothetical protein